MTIVEASEEEWIEFAAPYLQKESEERKKEILRKIQQHYQNYDLPKNWEKWMACQKKCTHSLFLFAKRPVPNNKTLFSAYIINVPEVAWTLQKHYMLFSRELKMDFDPVDASLEFEAPNSIFWEKVLANHLLQGILHGYGERNAYFFSRQFSQEKKYAKCLNDCVFTGNSSAKDEREGDTLEDLQIPLFRSYAMPYGEDPIIIKYEQERTFIQKRLKGRNLVNEILDRLYKCNPENVARSTNSQS
jgi:hypothetical protein